MARGLSGRPRPVAAIFDLFGTLVPEFPRDAFYASVRAAARVLGADEEAFEAEWMRTAAARQTGGYAGGIAENLVEICGVLGLAAPDDATLERALADRAAMYGELFHPRDGALETVTALKERGVPLGLISMCAPDTPALWRASPFAGLMDVEVFSSESGLRKPDPAIYRAATDALGVDPGDCCYCGDGAYAELTGAAALGMLAVEIRDPAIDHAAQLRPEGEDWDGPRVEDLRELLALWE